MHTDGPWVTCDHMLWGDDFHLNYNFQAAFYGAVGSNRPELADSYFPPVLNHVPIARTNAQRDFGCPGIVVDGAIGPRGMLATHVVKSVMRSRFACCRLANPKSTALSLSQGDMGQRSDAAFVAVNFVSRWLYTRDKAFLTDSFQTESLGWAREKVTPYDLLKDVAAFWMCYLEVGTHLLRCKTLQHSTTLAHGLPVLITLLRSATRPRPARRISSTTSTTASARSARTTRWGSTRTRRASWPCCATRSPASSTPPPRWAVTPSCDRSGKKRSATSHPVRPTLDCQRSPMGVLSC